MPFWGDFLRAIHELLNQMWWGLLMGILALTLLRHVPRELVVGLLGRSGGLAGILRATAAGLLLDLCNHGILLVAAKLYERGASLGQTFAFLIASPWNSLSTTLVLWALLGWQWTMVVVLLSAAVAIVTGCLVEVLVAKGKVAPHPHRVALPEDFHWARAARAAFRQIRPSWRGAGRALWEGCQESRMILRWLFLGAILAAALRGGWSAESYQTWLGPSLLGLGLTLVAATLIEVCSEGSSPLAADLFHRAQAPGNGFTFLMAGAATDYTELMVLREATGRWRLALLLPLLTVPQVLVLAWVLNQLPSVSS
ncbi:MAG: permease [Verrucomicrobiota bacterium]